MRIPDSYTSWKGFIWQNWIWIAFAVTGKPKYMAMRTGGLLSVGHTKIFLLQNDLNLDASQVISTYVYRKGMVESRYDFSTAIGLFQNVVSLALVMIANWFARKANPEYKII